MSNTVGAVVDGIVVTDGDALDNDDGTVNNDEGLKLFPDDGDSDRGPAISNEGPGVVNDDVTVVTDGD